MHKMPMLPECPHQDPFGAVEVDGSLILQAGLSEAAGSRHAGCDQTIQPELEGRHRPAWVSGASPRKQEQESGRPAAGSKEMAFERRGRSRESRGEGGQITGRKVPEPGVTRGQDTGSPHVPY